MNFYMNNYDLLTFASAEELAHAAALAWLDEVVSAKNAGRRYSVAFSGGRITQKLFTAAVKQAQAREISFAHVHFFWADERCVPPTDAESNFRQANEFFFSQIKSIVPAQIHRLQGDISPKVAAKLAEEELQGIKMPGENGQPTLDLVFLGMGEDGHVASLFPNAGPEVWGCSANYLAVENSPKPPPNRITLSLPAIVRARQVWTLISGAGKEAALRASLSPGETTPLARVISRRVSSKIFADFNL